MKLDQLVKLARLLRKLQSQAKTPESKENFRRHATNIMNVVRIRRAQQDRNAQAPRLDEPTAELDVEKAGRAEADTPPADA